MHWFDKEKRQTLHWKVGRVLHQAGLNVGLVVHRLVSILTVHVVGGPYKCLAPGVLSLKHGLKKSEKKEYLLKRYAIDVFLLLVRS